MLDGKLVRTPAIAVSSATGTMTLYGEGTAGATYERQVAPALAPWRYDGGALVAGAGAASFD